MEGEVERGWRRGLEGKKVEGKGKEQDGMEEVRGGRKREKKHEEEE